MEIHSSNKQSAPWSVRQRLFLFLGKTARFFIPLFRPEYVKRQIALRRGYCACQGACCQIGIKCPFYDSRAGTKGCRIYGFRFSQCSFFPLNNFDLAAVKEKCGYYFEDKVELVTVELPPKVSKNIFSKKEITVSGIPLSSNN